MARRSTPPARPERPVLSIAQKRRCIERLRDRIKELEAFDPTTVQKRWEEPEVKALEAGIDEAISTAFGHGTVDYDRYSSAACLDNGSLVLHTEFRSPHEEAFEAQKYLTEGKQRSIVLLGRAIASLEEQIADEEALAQPTTTSAQAPATVNRKVFVVHGHAGEPREAVARFLEAIGFEPIVLHEQPNRGHTIIEKFEANADVGFAVVILTPDDVGGAVGGPQQRRARQNVVLELGYFIGRLKRARVCALKVGDLELPSDILGIAWTAFDERQGWKQALARELQAAEYEIDWNKVMR